VQSHFLGVKAFSVVAWLPVLIYNLTRHEDLWWCKPICQSHRWSAILRTTTEMLLLQFPSMVYRGLLESRLLHCLCALSDPTSEQQEPWASIFVYSQVVETKFSGPKFWG